MKYLIRPILALLVALAAARLCAQPPDEAAVQTKVAALLAQMTTEEKIGQLVQYSSPGLATGPSVRAHFEGELAAGRCGSMLNVFGAEDTRTWQELAVKHSRLHIPLLFGFDVIHGYRTIFPINLGQAASFDPALIERSERIAATEASAAGIHWTFAPMVDIARDPRWGRIAEGSGEDTFLGSAIARARVHGFQGDDLSRTDAVLACVKHFAGYGAALAGRDYNRTDIPEITLRQVYLPPFKAALDAGAATFMSAFNDLNGTPCTANAFLFTQVLRHEWGFKGFVVSDWTAVRELLAHGVAADDVEAGRIAFNAGVDIDMESRIYGPQLGALLKSGAVSMARLDEAVSAILAAKFRLGLFDDPYRFSDPQREAQATLTAANLAAARELARESCVLLKNDRTALPLKPGARIALIGALAESQNDLLGEWRGRGRPEDAISIRTALESALPHQVTYVKGCEVESADRRGFAAAVAAAKKADIVVAVLGESWHMSGEAASRTNIDIPGVQTELLAALHRTGKPVVLVVFAGRPLTLGSALEHADAVLYAWFPGTMGGPAVADLLAGAVSPSGKLPVTFPRSVGQIPIYYNETNTGRPIPADDPTYKFCSRYQDSPNEPQFPFGFGLSYTNFNYTAARVASATLADGAAQRVSVTVTNAGDRAGTEVVQLYVRDLVGSVTRPVRELKGFQRVTLQPGEAREVVFTLQPSDLAFVHTDLTVAPEPGRFQVFVGGDSTAPLAGEFTYVGAKKG